MANSGGAGADEQDFGYHLLFEPTPDYKFVCPICLGVVKRAVQTLQCGHRFCYACFTVHERSTPRPFCPVDKNPLQAAPSYFFDIAFDREVRSLTLKCTNDSKGCDWTGELGSLEDHMTLCMRDTRACDLGCGLHIKVSELENHKLVCDRRLVECDLCKVMVPVTDVMNHQVLTCSKFPIGCTSCGNLGILREEYDGHVDEVTGDCPATIVPCVFGPMGCDFRDRRGDIQRHHESSSINHSSIMINMVMTIANDLKSIKKEQNLRRMHMSRVEQASEFLRWDQGNIRREINSLYIKLNSFENISHDGSLLWRVVIPKNETNNRTIRSPHFFLGYPGYRFIVSVTFPPINSSDIIKASLHLLRNKLCTLPYPISGSINLNLYHQVVEGSNPASVEQSDPCTTTRADHTDGRKVFSVRRNFRDLIPGHGEESNDCIDIDLIKRDQLWIDSFQQSGHVFVQVKVTQDM